MDHNSSDGLYAPQFQHQACATASFALNDSFGSASSFVFDEEDEQFQAAMQLALALFSQDLEVKRDNQPYHAMKGISDTETPPGAISTNLLPQTTYNQQGEVSPLTTSWCEQIPTQVSMQVSQLSLPQAALMFKCGNSIAQFGQISPREDTFSAEPADRHHSVGAARPASTQAESERDRNAAKLRHSKTEKAKRESFSSRAESLPDGKDRHEIRREKNRLAAAKCRAKQKNNLEAVEEAARIAGYQNAWLKQEARKLRDEFSKLRLLALMHDKMQGCKCSDMHTYNQNKAQEQVIGRQPHLRL